MTLYIIGRSHLQHHLHTALTWNASVSYNDLVKVNESINYSNSFVYVYLVLAVTQQSDFRYCLGEDCQLCFRWAFLLHLIMLHNAMLGQVEEGRAANPGREKISICEQWILLILLRKRLPVCSSTLLSVGQSTTLLIREVKETDSQSVGQSSVSQPSVLNSI